MNNSSIHEYSGGALIAAHRGSRGVRVAIYPPPRPGLKLVIAKSLFSSDLGQPQSGSQEPKVAEVVTRSRPRPQKHMGCNRLHLPPCRLGELTHLRVCE
jgi:hypothetical protein